FVLMLLLAYRSVVAIVVTALPLLSGAVVGFALLALIFGHAHGITVAFGFIASGVAGLQQLAVFTIGGLIVAGVCTRWLLPRVVPPAMRDMAATPGLARAWHFL